MSYDQFIKRHIGPRDQEVAEMLEKTGADSMDDFIDSIVPADIRLKQNEAADNS